jgi:hypothetical protein
MEDIMTTTKEGIELGKFWQNSIWHIVPKSIYYRIKSYRHQINYLYSIYLCFIIYLPLIFICLIYFIRVYLLIYLMLPTHSC